MTSSTIDSLLQIAPPARAAEPSRQAAAPPFDSALSDALVPVKTPAPAAASAPAQPSTPSTAAEDGDEARPEDQQEEAAGVIESAAEETDEEDAPAEDAASGTDEVSLSEAAASAAAEPGAEVQVVVAKSGGEKPLDEQAAGDQATGDRAAPAPQAEEAAGAKAKEAEAAEAPLQGKLLEKFDAAAKAPAAITPRGGARRESRDDKPTDASETTPRVLDSARSKESLKSHSVDGQSDAPVEGGGDARAVAEQQVEVEIKANRPVETRSSKYDGADVASDAPAQRPDALAPLDAPNLSAESEAKPQAALDETAAKPASEAGANTSESRAASVLDRVGASRAIQPSTPGAGDAEAGAPIDRTRFIQRVEGALRRAHERDGRVQVRLSPPELGNLRIEIALQNGVLTAKLEAETPAARNLLLDNLPALRERLAQQDIRVEKFDVDVRRDGAGGGTGSAGDHSARDRAADREALRQNDSRPKPAAARSAATVGGRASVNAHETTLDIRI